jgi:hypothetical protein
MNDRKRRKHLVPPPLSELLGDLPQNPYESGLRVNQKPQPAKSQPDAAEEQLALPRGGLVAMRRSGGIKFRSREVVVYRDGRVNYDDGEGSGPRTVWTLSDAELAELRDALDQADLPHQPASAGRQNPDAFAYEIVARPGRRAYAVEVFQGSIPPTLAPLIQRLNHFM